MKLSNKQINAVLQLVLPIVVSAAIVGGAYLYYIRPVFTAYLRARTEAQQTESRLRGVQDVVARGRQAAWPDEAEPMRLFEARVSRDEHVADVVEALTQALSESLVDGKLRNLAIGTGDEALETKPAAVKTAVGGEAEPIDPRWGLFPYRLTHTPVTLSFDCSYGTIVNFLWRVRDLPTAIEVRSIKLTRGLPLMSVKFTFFVLQRGDILQPIAQQPPMPEIEMPRRPGVEQPELNPFGPRLLKPAQGKPGG